MRAVVQRVHRAAVSVGGRIVAKIESGLLVYVGVAANDESADARYIAEKIRYLRIFADAHKPLNRDVIESGGSVLLVSAFTTQADARKGRRPALSEAAAPDNAERLYVCCRDHLADCGVRVATGCFGEHMDVDSTNDGPICVLIDSTKLF